MRRIDELHMEFPFAGARMLARLLRREGHEIGRRRARTLMKRMGIERNSGDQKASFEVHDGVHNERDFCCRSTLPQLDGRIPIGPDITSSTRSFDAITEDSWSLRDGDLRYPNLNRLCESSM